MAWLSKGSGPGLDPATFQMAVRAAGLSRILEHMAEGPFALMSAEKSDMTPRENEDRTARLREAVRGLGGSVGFLPAKGVWQGASENSMLIPGVSREDARGLAHQFQQAAFIWGEGGQWQEYATDSGAPTGNGGDVMDSFHFLGTGDEAEDAGAYTEMRGRRWTLLTPTQETMSVAELEKFRYGGFVASGKRWFTLTQKYDTDRSGRPYFFLWGPQAGKHESPMFGVAVHDAGDGAILRTGKRSIEVRLLAAYIPLKKA